MSDPLRSIDRPGLGRATMGYQPAENDLLSEVLRDLRLAHARYGRSELTAPWGIAVPFREGVRFHAMLEGHCWIQAKGLPPLLLENGDVLLLPHGTEHTMSDRPKRRTLPLADVKPALIGNGTYELKSGGGGARSLIACCTIGFEGPTANPLLELLPSVMHIRHAEHGDTDLPSLIAMMAREAEGQRIGSATIMARLADIVMTQVIRTSGRDMFRRSDWLAGGRAGSTNRVGACKNPSLPWGRLASRSPGCIVRAVAIEVLAAVQEPVVGIPRPLSPAMEASAGGILVA
ncbi:cupin domain-containing protein [Mesorhizobium sp. M0923]|uniref:cupin domain-containing protein n=1 Tax=Mesorhizobium sp. M0923 TaxID=2957028 RepID=UPI00333CEF4D